VAVVEYVVTTSQVTALRRVLKHSRAIWQPQHRKYLQDVVYDTQHPKIVTLELSETVFFGSSLMVFSQICDEIGLSATSSDFDEIKFASPRHVSGRSPAHQRQNKNQRQKGKHGTLMEEARAGASRNKFLKPRYVVLDVTQVANVDASAARTCFLQLAKMCAKNGIVLCAAGANRRVDWILRSHDVSYDAQEEDRVKGLMLNPVEDFTRAVPSGKLILFSSVNECLELCENQLIYELEQVNLSQPPKLGRTSSKSALHSDLQEEEVKTPLSTIVGRMLGSTDENTLGAFDDGGKVGAREIEYLEGDIVFKKGDVSDSFFLSLSHQFA